MNAQDCAPGTLVKATHRGQEITALRVESEGIDLSPWRSVELLGRRRTWKDEDLTNVRPLVVFAGPTGWDSNTIVGTLRDHASRCAGQGTCDLNRIADGIEAYGKPKAPAEPKAVGDLVSDANSHNWLRVNEGDVAPWCRVVDGTRATYDQLVNPTITRRS